MKKILLIPMLFAFLSIGLYSCKKDGSNSGSNQVKLLTSARWTFQKYEYKQNGAWIPDPYAADANKFTVAFNTDNTFSEYNVTYGETSLGTWNFSSNDTVLTTTGGYDIFAGAYAVTQLTSSTLQITNLNYPGYEGERITFAH